MIKISLAAKNLNAPPDFDPRCPSTDYPTMATCFPGAATDIKHIKRAHLGDFGRNRSIRGGCFDVVGGC